MTGVDRVELSVALTRYGERNTFLVALNLGKELEHERDNETELDAGWNYDLGTAAEDGTGRCKAGLELVQDFTEHHLRAGPLLTWQASRRVHVLTSFLPALDDRGEGNFDELAFIVEFEL